ncbi:hypothetical protein D3C72_1047470 [compost metagenome]
MGLDLLDRRRLGREVFQLTQPVFVAGLAATQAFDRRQAGAVQLVLGDRRIAQRGGDGVHGGVEGRDLVRCGFGHDEDGAIALEHVRGRRPDARRIGQGLLLADFVQDAQLEDLGQDGDLARFGAVLNGVGGGPGHIGQRLFRRARVGQAHRLGRRRREATLI